MNTARSLLLAQLLVSLAVPGRAKRPADDPGSDRLQSELLAAAPSVPAFQARAPVRLGWESSRRPEAARWSAYAESVVSLYLDEFDKAADAPLFCRRYASLDRDQRVEVWADVMAWVSYWETGWDPRNRTAEPDQGVDDVTGRPVYSEGLLQLSYQDRDSNPYCAFDWTADKNLPAGDLRRSILNPYENLYCGVRTMADLVAKNGRAAVAQGGYWSTLQLGSVHDRSRQIEREVGGLPFCGGRSHGAVAEGVLRALKDAQAKLKALGER